MQNRDIQVNTPAQRMKTQNAFENMQTKIHSDRACEKKRTREKKSHAINLNIKLVKFVETQCK